MRVQFHGVIDLLQSGFVLPPVAEHPREVARDERMREFVRAAVDADIAIDAGAAVYRADDVHAWLDRLATNPKSPRPRPWRK